MSALHLSDILVYETATEPALKEGAWSTIRGILNAGKAVSPKKVDLTATAANLDDATLERIKAAKEINGSNEEFQTILVTLAIKEGLLTNEALRGLYDPAAERKKSLYGTAIHTMDRLLDAREKEAPVGQYPHDFDPRGPFLGVRRAELNWSHWNDSWNIREWEDGSPLMAILEGYAAANPGLDLEKARKKLEEYGKFLHGRAESDKKRAQRIEAAPVRDRILGSDAATVLRVQADRPGFSRASDRADHAASK